MSKIIHNEIRSEYAKRQKQAYDSLTLRQNEVYSKIPRILDIENEINLLGVKYNKQILFSAGSTLNLIPELQSKMEALRLEKEQLLKAAGFPHNQLELHFKCNSCKDTGFVEDDGVTSKCSCYRQLLINQLFRQSNLKLTETENFSSFNEDVYPIEQDESRYGLKISPRENIIGIKKRCLQFIDNFNSPDEKNLFFSGPTGVGKTFMSNCIASELMNRGITVLYQTATILFDTISEYKMKAFKDDEYEGSGYKNIFEAELLILDDLGTETQSASRYAELLNTLNTRQLNNLTKPCKTIISTNIGAKQLHEFYTDRVMSRIVGSFDRLMFAGKDLRNLK